VIDAAPATRLRAERTSLGTCVRPRFGKRASRSVWVAVFALAAVAVGSHAVAAPAPATRGLTSSAVTSSAVTSPKGAADRPAAGEVGGAALAIHAAKLLTVAPDGLQYIDRGTILVRDGRIQSVGSRASIDVPADAEQRELGELWVMPGMVDLHSHIGGSMDINDAVYQASPELRASVSTVPANRAMRMALAAGVTTVLFIPGSATTMGGQGVLLKTGLAHYEAARIRDPGALKVAQADNPARWGYGMGRIFLNWSIDEISRRGVAYALRWQAYERGEGEKPAFDAQYEVFRPLLRGEIRVVTHTQVAQVVLSSMRILTGQNSLPMFIAHGEFDATKIAHIAQALGVPAILGPRNMSSQVKSRGVDHDGRLEGLAWAYQQAGHTAIGFNTDAPVLPGEELFLQASVAVRLGFCDDALDTVRGLTIVPAQTAGIADRVGSLEPGKDADLVALSGHPADPRTRVEAVWIEGQLLYDAARDGRRF